MNVGISALRIGDDVRIESGQKKDYFLIKDSPLGDTYAFEWSHYIVSSLSEKMDHITVETSSHTIKIAGEELEEVFTHFYRPCSNGLSATHVGTVSVIKAT
jgi:hypothetical protein